MEQNVQRHGGHYMTSNYTYNNTIINMLHHLEWPTLEQHRRHAYLTMMFELFDQQMVDINPTTTTPSATAQLQMSPVHHKRPRFLTATVSL